MRTCVAVIILVILPCLALADVIHLKDGTRLEGDIVTMDEAKIEIRLPYGTLTVKREDIQRIEFGAPEEEPEKKEPVKEPEPIKLEKPEKKEPEVEPEEKLEPPKVEEPEVHSEPTLIPAKPKGRKSPTTAAALAIVPGGGYAYLRRWDLALATAGAEGGLGTWGIILATDDDDGNNSTAYVVLGLVGLIKIIEVFDSYDKAMEWNRSLGLEVGQSKESFFLGLTANF